MDLNSFSPAHTTTLQPLIKAPVGQPEGAPACGGARECGITGRQPPACQCFRHGLPASNFSMAMRQPSGPSPLSHSASQATCKGERSVLPSVVSLFIPHFLSPSWGPHVLSLPWVPHVVALLSIVKPPGPPLLTRLTRSRTQTKHHDHDHKAHQTHETHKEAGLRTSDKKGLELHES